MSECAGVREFLLGREGRWGDQLRGDRQQQTGADGPWVALVRESASQVPHLRRCLPLLADLRSSQVGRGGEISTFIKLVQQHLLWSALKSFTTPSFSGLCILFRQQYFFPRPTICPCLLVKHFFAFIFYNFAFILMDKFLHLNTKE
jgi:hypothetical protein